MCIALFILNSDAQKYIIYILKYNGKVISFDIKRIGIRIIIVNVVKYIFNSNSRLYINGTVLYYNILHVYFVYNNIFTDGFCFFDVKIISQF